MVSALASSSVALPRSVSDKVLVSDCDLLCRGQRVQVTRTLGISYFFTFIFLLLELRRLFGRSGPRGCRDGAGLEGLAGRRGGRAGSLRGTLGRLGRRGGGGAMSPCGRREEVSEGVVVKNNKNIFKKRGCLTSSWLVGLEEKKQQ